MIPRTLSATEARVLSVLVEKQHTVPDSYPLSLNALTAGCNQKTAREPVMNLSEADVLQALAGLKELTLAHEVHGSRVVRFDHNAAKGLGVPSQAVALLTTLMLRGPLTAAELRLHCERLHKFADISSVEGFLDELAEKSPPRVVKLPKAPGSREHRWAHLLCGEPQLPTETASSSASAGIDAAQWQQLLTEHADLQQQVQQLRATVQFLAKELGVSIDDLPSP